MDSPALTADTESTVFPYAPSVLVLVKERLIELFPKVVFVA
jgi:hypothetical protein